MCSTLLVVQRPLSLITRSLTRALFSFPNISSSPLVESKVETYNEQKLFPYRAKELYAIVSDVALYPRFIPFCLDSQIDSSAHQRAMQEKTVVDAKLTVGFLNFKESHVSVLTCTPFESVENIASSSTHFKKLSTTWRFQRYSESTFKPEDDIDLSDPPGPTLVSFNLTYQFANPIHASISSTFFGRVFQSKLTLQAFEDRFLQVYGPRL